jgi:putative spermidine/putrescine transport system permease protein
MIDRSRPAQYALTLFAILGVLFLTVPLIIVIPMSFSSAQALTFPPPSFSLRWYYAFFSDPSWTEAMWTSTLIAVLSSVLALLLGGLAAYGLRRGTFMGRNMFEGLFMAPMIVPAVIVAIALYIGLARVGLLGSFIGLVIAHTILSVPIVLMVLGEAIRQFDVRIEQVAWSLGASWQYTFRKVVIPNIAPSAFAAWIFAFISSFDEVIITSFIAGRYETVPKKMFTQLMLEVTPTITAVATLLVAFTILALVAAAIVRSRAKGGAEAALA